MDIRRWLVAGLFAATGLVSGVARAAGPSCALIGRENLIGCALAASLEHRAGEAAVEAGEGRVLATEPWLPAPPRLEVSGARREASSRTALNWSVGLELELEVAGQRGARKKAALAARDAGRHELEATDQAVAAAAWRAYFDVLAAEAALALAGRAEAATGRVQAAARAAAAAGSSAGIEADLAEAAHVRSVLARIEATRELAVAEHALAAQLGLVTANLRVAGALEPLTIPGQGGAGPQRERPEVLALEAERRAFSERASAERRRRIPNPTLAAFLASEGFDERVAGVTLSLPLPLPEPVGRMQLGEVRENEALAERARLLAEQGRREARAALLRARAEYEAARAADAAHGAEQLARAAATLESLAANVAGGRLAVKDAVLAQGPLFELLLTAVEAKRRLCHASVELTRAAGSPEFLGVRR